MRLLLLILLTSCGYPEFSPWQSDVEDSRLTSRHLSLINQSNGEFSPFKIALTGDPQAVAGHLRKVIQKTNGHNIAFLAILGDMTDLGLRKEWMWIKSMVQESHHPVLTVVGNHDGLSMGKDIYQRMFGPFDYSFVYRGVKFVMWNNNYYEWGEPNFDWLEDEVEFDGRVVIMSHQPPYSGTLKDHHEERWKEIRAHPSVKASFHGHVHHFNHRYESVTDTIISTADRVTGAHFSIVEFLEDSIIVKNCTPKCGENFEVPSTITP